MQKTIADLAGRWLKHRPGKLGEAESRVFQSAIDRQPIARDIGLDLAQRLSAGDRIADAIARIGGSWGFILSFIAFLVLWTIVGGVLLYDRTFDPYPFIFLNLILSMIAALQAPVIMMSQNRQSQHDRIDAAHDYEVNLKAEIEIMALHEKFDELRHQDMLLMRDQISQLQDIVLRLETRLSDPTRPA